MTMPHSPPSTPPSRASSTSPSPSTLKYPSEHSSLVPRAAVPSDESHRQEDYSNNFSWVESSPNVAGVPRNSRSVSRVSQFPDRGSVRHYGATPVGVGKPSPVDQIPRVSERGRRRILNTWSIKGAFALTFLLALASVFLTFVLIFNAVTDLSVDLLPYRGSGFAEIWIALLGSWAGIGGLIFFSHPSYLFFLTSLVTTLLLGPLFILTHSSSRLRTEHWPLIVVPLSLTAATLCSVLLSNFLVRRVFDRESQRVCRMMTDSVGNDRSDQLMARALVGMQGRSFHHRVTVFFRGLVGLIAGLAGLIVLLLLLIDFSIAAYDGTVKFPSESSQLITIKVPLSPWPISIHISCSDPPNSTQVDNFPWNRRPPTILYNSPSGVPGSLALLKFPLPPAKEGENPGRWLYDIQRTEPQIVGRVCTWDRPGYGFSDVMVSADLGRVADALWLALNGAGEVEGRKFLLVGEGYGGLISRVFAGRHPEVVHSFLHLDAQTAWTYYNEAPNGLSPMVLLIHRLTTAVLPSLLSPLSYARLPSVLSRQSSSLSRILASVYPWRTIAYNDRIGKARLQELFESHSHSSASFRALLESWTKYPATKPTVVVSSATRMAEVPGWEDGQDGLAHEVTSEEGLVAWEKVVDVGHYVCEGGGKEVCERSLLRLLNK